MPYEEPIDPHNTEDLALSDDDDFYQKWLRETLDSGSDRSAARTTVIRMTTSGRATCPTTTARKTRTTTRAPFLYILLIWSRGRSSSFPKGRGDGAGVGGDGAPRDDGAIV